MGGLETGGAGLKLWKGGGGRTGGFRGGVCAQTSGHYNGVAPCTPRLARPPSFLRAKEIATLLVQRGNRYGIAGGGWAGGAVRANGPPRDTHARPRDEAALVPCGLIFPIR